MNGINVERNAFGLPVIKVNCPKCNKEMFHLCWRDDGPIPTYNIRMRCKSCDISVTESIESFKVSPEELENVYFMLTERGLKTMKSSMIFPKQLKYSENTHEKPTL